MRTGTKRATAGMLALAGVMYAGYEGTGPVIHRDGVTLVKAYKDSVNVTTICFGETRAERPDLKMGDTDTLQNCKDRLPLVLKKYDDGLTACLNRDIPEGMHIVLISTTANIGIAAFCHSSMARDIKSGNFTEACHDLMLWTRAGSNAHALERRRRLEEHDCLMALRGEHPATSPTSATQQEPTPQWKPPATSLPSSASSPSSSPSGSSSSSLPTAKPVLPSRHVPLLSRLLHSLRNMLP